MTQCTLILKGLGELLQRAGKHNLPTLSATMTQLRQYPADGVDYSGTIIKHFLPSTARRNDWAPVAMCGAGIKRLASMATCVQLVPIALIPSLQGVDVKAFWDRPLSEPQKMIVAGAIEEVTSQHGFGAVMWSKTSHCFYLHSDVVVTINGFGAADMLAAPMDPKFHTLTGNGINWPAFVTDVQVALHTASERTLLAGGGELPVNSICITSAGEHHQWQDLNLEQQPALTVISDNDLALGFALSAGARTIRWDPVFNHEDIPLSTGSRDLLVCLDLGIYMVSEKHALHVIEQLERLAVFLDDVSDPVVNDPLYAVWHHNLGNKLRSIMTRWSGVRAT